MPNNPDNIASSGKAGGYMDPSVHRRVAEQKLFEDIKEGEPRGGLNLIP